jgi:hypothetical protein
MPTGFPASEASRTKFINGKKPVCFFPLTKVYFFEVHNSPQAYFIFLTLTSPIARRYTLFSLRSRHQQPAGILYFPAIYTLCSVPFYCLVAVAVFFRCPGDAYF